MADFLFTAGADIELGCSTPLMEAAQEGHLELVKYLLKASMYHRPYYTAQLKLSTDFNMMAHFE